MVACDGPIDQPQAWEKKCLLAERGVGVAVRVDAAFKLAPLMIL